MSIVKFPFFFSLSFLNSRLFGFIQLLSPIHESALDLTHKTLLEKVRILLYKEKYYIMKKKIIPYT